MTVSKQQEENFNNFIKFLDQQESFKLIKDSIKNAYVIAFVAMKENDYDKYVIYNKRVGEILEKLSRKQKDEILEFFKTLVPPEFDETKVPVGSCKVSCLFGSCEITCPDGSKPKCRCEWYGAPDGSCEPYNPN
ncbi:MAG: hypothetical protein IGBAC_1425 [Ignavibacteriae bacterium]|nr:MAG: hypothetical protein IGBAC_1425 [Ignavibacteriota bacterium]